MLIEKTFTILGLLAFLFLATLVSGIVFLVSFKKKSIFKTSAVVFGAVALIFTTFLLWSLSHGVSFKYNDWWIVGNEIQDVQKRYGDFDVGEVNDYAGEVAYYLCEDSGIMSSHQSLYYYYIRYDENGIVTRVFVGGPYGG